MQKISKSLLLIAVIAILAIGATRSYFSDTETLAGNTMAVGNLDIAIGEESVTPISLENLKPGDTIEQIINVQNIGSIDIGSLKMSVLSQVDDLGLLDQLDVTIHYVSNSGANEEATIDFDTLKANSISGFELNSDGNFNLLSGNSGVITLSIYVPAELGNEFQLATASFDVVLDAEQAIAQE